MSKKQPNYNDKILENKAISIRLLEYCKYLYEDENAKGDRLNGITKIYLSFVTFTFGICILKSANIKQIIISNNELFVVKPIFITSSTLILISFFFTILAVKIRGYERLCKPAKTMIKADSIKYEEELIKDIIADYSVATERNYIMNQKKGKLLRYAMAFYVFGLFVFVCFFMIIYS